MSKRLRSKLVWQQAEPTVKRFAAQPGYPERTVVEQQPPESPCFQVDLAPHDLAIGLLHIGAEVEHALMVQYLYAAYSIDEAGADETWRPKLQKWKSTILEIAREEMGHLATVQNLLTLIGGALSFEREEFPIIDPELWPFPFELEPLTKKSLAKYVLAEMPSHDVLVEQKLEAEMDAIVDFLKTDCVNVHRVGYLYEKILEVFTMGPMIQGPEVKPFTCEHPYIATVDIQGDKLKYQASPGSWALGNHQVLVFTASDRKSAQAAITKISVQGEGSKLPEDLHESHFWRFLEMYRAFPEDRPVAKPVATNPTTNPRCTDKQRRIGGQAEPWALLANLRYRMLLAYLQHSFHFEARPQDSSGFPGAALISWAFGEMYHIRSLSGILMNLPLSDGSKFRAAPPFEMPDILSLPIHDGDRWRMHRDLLTAVIALNDKMLPDAPEHAGYLRAMRAADETALQQVTTLIGA